MPKRQTIFPFFGISNVLVFLLCEINHLKRAEIYKSKRLAYFQISLAATKTFDTIRKLCLKHFKGLRVIGKHLLYRPTMTSKSRPCTPFRRGHLRTVKSKYNLTCLESTLYNIHNKKGSAEKFLSAMLSFGPRFFSLAVFCLLRNYFCCQSWRNGFQLKRKSNRR